MENTRKMLFDKADTKYKEFSEKLAKSNKEMIGVRLPDIKKTAKLLAKDFKGDFSFTGTKYFEEVMLRGFIIAYSKLNLKEKLKLISSHLKHIDNWSCCDSFCASLKFKLSEKQEVFEFIKSFSHSENEFEVRFFIVMMLMHFTDEKYIDEVFKCLKQVKHNGYYVKMAVSWALCEAFIKHREKTLEIFKKNNFDDFIHNKAIVKCTESFRVSKEDKEFLKTLKR